MTIRKGEFLDPATRPSVACNLSRTSRSGVALLAVALLVGSVGCRCYQMGSLMHPQINSIAVGRFANDTDEPRLGPLIQAKAAEHLMVDGSVKLVVGNSADAILQGKIVSYQINQLASSKIRAKANRDRDSDAYQPAIWRARVTVEFQLTRPGSEDPVLTARRTTGYADLSRFPDLNVSRQEGLQMAANDAAIRMTASVTEAW
ncbi:MAG: hypothetical protein HN742_09920 [Lentisphaerae bacterium]|jgi:hypothetical protein|nr:hypothetical protein [Lentisphaerota bacterium]MBT4821321.1 hypothetical protein [Lentisphaerota bacterium]MBT5610445.1 hypothetical protein [Lentisphaerota bacterium]MBT7061036.1 hypothetical protein [Lentisphaerota bacterium]MBT7842179.1 hypothetical protein [Lentisphaerota bacterium]